MKSQERKAAHRSTSTRSVYKKEMLTVDAAVSSVGTATHGDGTVHLDVSDVQSFGFDTLDL